MRMRVCKQHLIESLKNINLLMYAILLDLLILKTKAVKYCLSLLLFSLVIQYFMYFQISD